MRIFTAESDMNHYLDFIRHLSALWVPRLETISHLANKLPMG